MQSCQLAYLRQRAATVVHAPFRYSPEVLAHAVREVGSQRPKVDEAHAVGTLQSIDAVWNELFPAEQAKVLHTLVERITVRVDGITIQWHEQGLNKLLRDTLAPEQALEAA